MMSSSVTGALLTASALCRFLQVTVHARPVHLAGLRIWQYSFICTGISDCFVRSQYAYIQHFFLLFQSSYFVSGHVDSIHAKNQLMSKTGRDRQLGACQRFITRRTLSNVQRNENFQQLKSQKHTRRPQKANNRRKFKSTYYIVSTFIVGYVNTSQLGINADPGFRHCFFQIARFTVPDCFHFDMELRFIFSSHIDYVFQL